MDSTREPGGWKRSVFDLARVSRITTPSLLVPVAVDLQTSSPNRATTFASPPDVSVHAMDPSWRQSAATSAPRRVFPYDRRDSGSEPRRLQRKSSDGNSSPSVSRQSSYQRATGDNRVSADPRLSYSVSNQSRGSHYQQQQQHRLGMTSQNNPRRLQGDAVEAQLAHAAIELAATRAPPAEELFGNADQDDAHRPGGSSGPGRGETPAAAKMMSRSAIVVVTVFLFLLIVLPALLPSISPPPSALLVIPVMLMFMLVYLALAPHHVPGRNHVYS